MATREVRKVLQEFLEETGQPQTVAALQQVMTEQYGIEDEDIAEHLREMEEGGRIKKIQSGVMFRDGPRTLEYAPVDFHG